MNPKLTAQLFHADDPTRFVLMAGDHVFASPFVVNDPKQAHALADAWNTYEEQRTMPMDALKASCTSMLRNSDVKPHTVTGKRMIHAYWAGALGLQQALGFTPSANVLICLLAGRHDELINKE